MPFGFGTLDEVSLIATIDGVGCEQGESVLGYWGLIIWIILAIYLMAGQFVICEEYFVPILAQLGDRWKMAEDVQGATLLAVGSSSPELFTALLGVIFYPDDNPGPGTNVGSAVFNMCIIIGLSAIFAPKSAKLQMIPFLRDSIAYMIGLIELYLFYAVISKGEMELWESLCLVGWWAIYVVMVYRTDFVATRCCCCIPQKQIEKTLDAIELEEDPKKMKKMSKNNGTYKAPKGNENDYRALQATRDDSYDDGFLERDLSYKHNPSILMDDHQGHRGVFYDERGHAIAQPVADMDQNPDNIRLAPGAEETMDEDLQKALDDLNRRQRQNINKGWVVVVMPADQAKAIKAKGMNVVSSSNGNVVRNDVVGINGGNGQQQASGGNAHAYVRRRTLNEILEHEIEAEHARQGHGGHGGDDEDEEHHGKGAQLLHTALKPWTKIFGWTLPEPEGQFAAKHIYVTIIMIVCWLGVLTFFVVDCSEKIGECFHIPGGLLGITLLAIGSSLPDCISSVIVARQMKIDMAVCNAFGSNIFDVNLCVGFGFLLGSIAAATEGKSTTIDLGDGHALLVFSELIIAAAGFLVFLWIMMWCSIFRLEKWMGWILCMGYIGYICVFTTLFVHGEDEGDDFGES